MPSSLTAPSLDNGLARRAPPSHPRRVSDAWV